MKFLNSIISGTGSYVPEQVIPNSAFSKQRFYQADHQLIEDDSETITKKFKDITGIEQRRYVSNELNTSDIASMAAQAAIEDADIDPESIDSIILAHNFGNVRNSSVQSDILPSLSARVKHQLHIKNPECIAYDILFGCPGWIQGLIQADTSIKAGTAKRILVIGAETLSRVIDPFDRDSMIFADGAGAAVIEAKEDDKQQGILAHAVRSDTYDGAYYLYFGESNKADYTPGTKYIKMQGRKIYEYALSNVPQAMKKALDKSGRNISEVKKIFIHQANEKMDEAMIKRLYRLYKGKPPKGIMPMSIHKLGNSSVATVPTLFDRVRRGTCTQTHELKPDDVFIFASVGAGMHINAMVYKY